MDDRLDSYGPSGAGSPFERRGEERVFPALIAGIVAALAGGAIWAAIVAVTNYEVGWVAWGVGALVGFAMSKATAARGRALGIAAAGLAAVGLIAGKAFILEFATRPALVGDIQADTAWMAQAAAFELQRTGDLPEDVQRQLDELASGDTISDTLWEEMLAVGAAHADTVGPEERERIAAQFADHIYQRMGFFTLLAGQMTVWDLLWFFLAVTTAWKIMAGGGAPEQPVDAGEGGEGPAPSS